MKNKKTFFLVFVSFLIAILFLNKSYALYELNDVTINKLVSNGYIISSKYSTEKLCNNKILEYNNQVSYYNRTDCFKNKSYYYYFKCDSGMNCDLNTIVNQNYNTSYSNTTFDPYSYNDGNDGNNGFDPTYIFKTYNNNTSKYYLKSYTTKTNSQITKYVGESLVSTYFISKDYVQGSKDLYISSAGAEGYLTYNKTANFVGYAWTTYSAGRVRIYNCIKGTDYFISEDSNCEGYRKSDNNVFYVYPDDLSLINNIINVDNTTNYNNNYNTNYNTISNTSTITNGNVYGAVLERDISYKGNLKLNIQTPNISSRVPVYIDVNSDLWGGGDRNFSFSANTSFMRENLLRNGIGYVSIDHTLSNLNTAGVYSVYSDIDCALQWIERNKTKYNLDTDNIYIGGIGAGGHLAMQYSLKQSSYRDNTCIQKATTPTIKKVLGISGIYDLTTNLSSVNMEQKANNFLGIQNTYSRINSQRAKDNSPVFSMLNQSSKSKQYYIIYDKNDKTIDYQKNSELLYNNMKIFGYNVKYDLVNNYSHNSNNGSNIDNKIIDFLKPDTSTINTQAFNQYYYNCILYGNNCDSATNGEVVAYSYITANNTQNIIAKTNLPKQNISYCAGTSNQCVRLDARWENYYEIGTNNFAGYKISIQSIPANTYVGYFKYTGSDGRTYKSNNYKTVVESSANGNVMVTGSQTAKVSFSIPEYLTANYFFNYNGGIFKNVSEGWNVRISNGLKTYTQSFSGLFKGVYNSYVNYGENRLNLNSINIY
ncbi:MAG: alpha/beta hydrolase fold domain-containing protein [Candidatus Gracilibacteria bacterium]|nr:alpha/beta hydrolase fold domain-containing protein [Candidatus Gracilibacteria bacterium]